MLPSVSPRPSTKDTRRQRGRRRLGKPLNALGVVAATGPDLKLLQTPSREVRLPGTKRDPSGPPPTLASARQGQLHAHLGRAWPLLPHHTQAGEGRGPASGDVCEGAAVVGEGKRRLRVGGHRVPTSSAPHPGPEGEESKQRA